MHSLSLSLSLSLIYIYIHNYFHSTYSADFDKYSYRKKIFNKFVKPNLGIGVVCI